MKKVSIILMLALAFALAGCNLGGAGTGDTASDPQAAQAFLPDLPDYNETNARSITDALAAIGVGGSAVTGNIPLAALIGQVDRMIQCYESTGAVAARVYVPLNAVEAATGVATGQIPSAGVLAIVNQDRLASNFLSCATGGGSDNFSAQAVQPCFGSGQFVSAGQTFHYIYGATEDGLCGQFTRALPAS